MTTQDKDSAPTGLTRRRLLTAGTASAAAAPVALVGSPPAAGASAGSGARSGSDDPLERPLPGRRTRPQEPDRELRAALREVEPERLRSTVESLVAFGTRHTLSSQDDPHRGIGAARDWIAARLRESAAPSQGRMTVELQSYVQPPASRIPVATRITNVVATIRGTHEPERVHVVSGHYDSRASDPLDATSDAPGADDDASGVAVVMELARILATRPLRATVVLAAVAGEEQGLYGAAHLAEQLKRSGVDVQSMFTNDIVGSPRGVDGKVDPRVVRLFAEGVPTSETPEQAATRKAVGGENDSPARQLARFVRDVAENDATGMRLRVVYRRDRYLRGGDHIPFLERAMPAARFTEPHEDYAHQHQDVRVEDGVQYGDLARFCDFAYVARVAAVNLATTWSLAQGPGTPKGVRILTAGLSTGTELVWQDGPADVAGYEVVYRESTAADWQRVVQVGRQTRAQLPLSKDNVLFGVRAVDHRGRRSPAAYPTPQR